MTFSGRVSPTHYLGAPLPSVTYNFFGVVHILSPPVQITDIIIFCRPEHCVPSIITRQFIQSPSSAPPRAVQPINKSSFNFYHSDRNKSLITWSSFEFICSNLEFYAQIYERVSNHHPINSEFIIIRLRV